MAMVKMKKNCRRECKFHPEFQQSGWCN